MTKKKIDEGLVEVMSPILCEAMAKFSTEIEFRKPRADMSDITRKYRKKLALAIQSYLKKEGYRKAKKVGFTIEEWFSPKKVKKLTKALNKEKGHILFSVVVGSAADYYVNGEEVFNKEK